MDWFYILHVIWYWQSLFKFSTIQLLFFPYNLGRALGSLVGGFMIAPLGIPTTFRLAAAVSAVTCVLYFIINRFFFHKQQLERKNKSTKTPQTNREETDVESNVVEHTSTKDTPNGMDSKVVKRVYSNSAFEKD